MNRKYIKIMRWQIFFSPIVILGIVLSLLASILTPAHAAPGPLKTTRPMRSTQTGHKATIVPKGTLSWETLWRDIWKMTNFLYPIEPAPTVLSVGVCSNLDIDSVVYNTIRSINESRYGDAVRYIAQFQERMLCLTPDGARGIEYALSALMYHAITKLPPDQAKIVIRGAFNLGVLTFDQMNYRGQSWWLMLTVNSGQSLAVHLKDYPVSELGIWLYDISSGILVQTHEYEIIERLIKTFEDPANFGDRTCSLLEMTQHSGPEVVQNTSSNIMGFICKGGSQDNSGGMNINSSGFGDGLVACTLDAVKTGGAMGQVSCLKNSASGLRPSIGDYLARPWQTPGVFDKQCLISEDSDGAGSEEGTDTTNSGDDPAPELKDKEWYEKGKDIAVDVFLAPFDKTPPIIDDLKRTFASEESAEAAGTILEFKMDQQYKGDLLQMGTEDYAGKWSEWTKKTREEKADYFRNKNNNGSQRTINEDGSQGGGCGMSTNAAQYVRASFLCHAGETEPIIPGKEVYDPSPDSITSPGGHAGEMLSCLSQSGSLVRHGSNDGRCAMMTCAGDEPCPCNPSLQEETGPMKYSGISQVCTPDPVTGTGCGQGPGGGISPGPLPGTPPIGPVPYSPVKMPKITSDFRIR